MARIVYVIGAGFSKPLGGPLLADLFTPTSVREALMRYPSVLDADACHMLQRVYAMGRNYEISSMERLDIENLRNKGKMWSDAEEFLGYLDSANHELGTVRRDVLSVAMLPAAGLLDPKKLLLTAKRLLAAECSGFLDLKVMGAEVWSTYEEWFSRLKPQDTLISFNYDTVPERLASGSEMQMVVPGQTEFRDCARYYKLHGSTDWRVFTESDATRVEVKAGYALTGDIEEYGMGYPGIHKQELVSKLKLLWQGARDAIIAADAVVFIGYRFPESDTFAMRHFLDALTENKNRRLYVHVVLGPDSASSVVVRMMELLKATMVRTGRSDAAGGYRALRDHGQVFSLRQHRFWSTDFITAVHREFLFRD